MSVEQKKLSSNAGVSIAEMMVYIILGLVVIGYALNAITDMAKGYTRSRTVMKMQKDGRDAVQIMAREIGNAGFKYYVDSLRFEVKKNNDADADLETFDQVFYVTRPNRNVVSLLRNADPAADNVSSVPKKDSILPNDVRWLVSTYCGRFNFPTGTLPADSAASFQFKNQGTGLFGDTLTIFAAHLAANGKSLTGVQRVTYFQRNDTLYRKELVAKAGTSPGTGLNLTTALANTLADSAAVWVEGDTVTMAVMNRVRALQFQFSENGRDWTSTPAGKRQRMKMVKIQVLVESDKIQKPNMGVNFPANAVGNLGAIAANGRLLRLYEKIAEIPNNGVLIN